MDALCKGVMTACLVWALLLVARRLGGRCAGFLTGLPTVSGPALLWMALDHGASYASLGAAGAVVGAIGCAAFARAYIWASRGGGALQAVGWAVAAGAVGVALGWFWSPSLVWAVPVATLTVLTLRGVELPRLVESKRDASASPLLTALVAGSITTVVTLGLGGLSAYGGGIVASLPVIAAAVATRQYGLGGGGAAHRFLDGYLAGLVGRIAFSGTFGFLVLEMSWPIALALALLGAVAVSLAVTSAQGNAQRSLDLVLRRVATRGASNH